MQTLRIKTELLPAFVESLKAWGTLWAPVERGAGTCSLEPIQDIRKARPDAVRTLLPFKKLLLPPRFAMMEARGAEAPVHRGATASQVYYGAHPCDIHALKILDLLFLSDFEDPRPGSLLRVRVEVRDPAHEAADRRPDNVCQDNRVCELPPGCVRWAGWTVRLQ